MNEQPLQYIIESILFAYGEPIKAAKLAAVLNTGVEQIEEAVRLLQYEYDENRRGFNIIEIDEGYQMSSREEYYPFIQELFGERRLQALSGAAMEALAIVAYKQPVTRSQVEYIRGVNSDGAMNRLLERDLIEEVGKLDAPGRPILYATTQIFLRCFGLRTPQELPPIDKSKLSEDYEQITIAE